MKLLRRLHYWINRRKIQSELEEEIESHRAMKREALEQDGLAPEQSYTAATRSMGNVMMAIEDSRHVWIWPSLDHLAQDVRYSLRLFWKNPVFTLIAVLSLALGIGANSMVSTMVNTILFKPLPVERPGRLVWAYATLPGSRDANGFSYPDYLDYRAESDTFSDLYAYNEMPLRISGTREPAVVWGAAATENFFTGLGLKASLGRTFMPSDGDAAGAVPLAIISDSLWRRQFGGDPTAIGKRITLNGRDFTIIGILPAAFSGTREFGFIPDIWIPLGMAGDDMIASMESLPGVAQATVAFPLPLDAYDASRKAVPEGFVPGLAAERGFDIGYSAVAPGYFATMQTHVNAGREFTEADSEATERAVIVNQTMARKFWPGENPLGKRIRLGVSEGKFATVIGVAQDGKYLTLGEAPQPYMFLAALQEFPNQATIVVRTKRNPAEVIAAARQQIREIDPALAALGIQSIDQFRSRLLSISDTLAILLATAGAIALVLAGIGLYGVISVSIGQRTHEIGIRIAIGARRSDVIGMIMKQSGRTVLVGVAAGALGTAAFGPLMSNLLYGVSPADTLTIAAAFGIVTLIAIVAIYVPAHRAAAANPLATLRCE